MSIKNNIHTIIPQETQGLFNVVNDKTGDTYEVDIFSPYCKGCPSYKWSKIDKKGNKKCKHIKMCKGINESNKIEE